MITITRENIDPLVIFEALILALFAFFQIVSIIRDWITVEAQFFIYS
ncbi:MAG: hypothetical protein ACFE95_16420 [Candidatus Hodarchaeota archaeon]